MHLDFDSGLTDLSGLGNDVSCTSCPVGPEFDGSNVGKAVTITVESEPLPLSDADTVPRRLLAPPPPNVPT